MSDSPDDPGTETPPDTRWPRLDRRTTWTLVTAVVAVILLAVITARPSSDSPPPGPIRIDAWSPYWVMERSIKDLTEHGGVLTDVSPFVYRTTGVDTIGLPSTVGQELIDSFISTAREAGLSVTPSIVDALEPGEMAALLADPTTRARHVAAIAALAEELNADGIDIDYEQFAFADDRATWAETRLAFADFIEELGVALRADGRRLVVSVPPVYDDQTTDESGYWVYDIGRIAESADQVRVMAYGYSGDAAGPVSPLAWVRRSIEGVVQAAGGTDRIVLGVPLYGTNVATSVSGTCPDDAPGNTAVTLRTIDDLIARRDAQPVYDDDVGEWSFSYELEIDGADGSTACTQVREVNYVDAAGTRARIDLAREYRLDAVALWALGYEDNALWRELAPIASPAD